jgi:hypothetical protein
VPFRVALLGELDGTTVERVVVRLKRPSGEFSAFSDSSPQTTTESVVAVWPLAADGSSVPEPGAWEWVAFFYSAADALLGWSDPGTLPVEPEIVPFP